MIVEKEKNVTENIVKELDRKSNTRYRTAIFQERLY